MTRRASDRHEALNEKLRETAKLLIAERYEGNASELARKLDIKPSSLKYFIEGRNGASIDLVWAFERVTGETFLTSDSSAETGTAWGAVPGWKEAELEALKEMDGLPPYVWVLARRLRGLVPPNPVTKQFVKDAILFVYRHMPTEEFVGREDDRNEREISKQVKADARGEKRKRASRAGKAQLTLEPGAPPAKGARKPRAKKVSAKKPSKTGQPAS